MNFDMLTGFLDSLSRYGIPGADLVVKRDHETLYRHQTGWRDREAGSPMRGDELYFMYSCSKVITVTAGMQLLERGMFLLNEPLHEFMPEYRDMQVKDAEGNLHKAQKPILVKHLFSMTAGLNYDLGTPAVQLVRASTDGRCPTRHVARAIAQTPLSFEPGTHWQYSLCHDVLAAFVEVVSGVRFCDYVKANIFDPLGMTRSYYHATPDLADQFAGQYRYDAEKGVSEPIAVKNDYILGAEYDSGGAGIISCVDDYARFASAMACDGVGETGERIIGRPAIDLMRLNQLSETALKDFNWTQMSGYGYGLGVRTLMDKATGGAMGTPGEFGWGGAAGSYVMIDPENHLSVFYGQHMLNNREPIVHPRLRNLTYSCLAR